MSYGSIYNFPDERARITFPFVWWDGLFTDEELDQIVEYCDEQGLERGLTVKSEGQSPEEDVRKSNVKFHNYNENTQFIFDKMNWVIQEMNNRFYNFDINGWESFQYGTYDGKEGGKYDWHMDMIMGNKRGDEMYLTRKLSVVMLLTEPGVDFEGGEFQINGSSESKPDVPELKKGRIIAFPSWMVHRVMPVTSGVRKSIVIWVLGPKFK